MWCPLTKGHRLLEIAEGLWQCPKCGFGPRSEGRFPFWAMSAVEIVHHEAEALAVRYDPKLDIYVATWLQWVVDGFGIPVPGSVSEELVEYISTSTEKAGGYLPTVLKSDDPNSDSVLQRMMWESPVGLKEI